MISPTKDPKCVNIQQIAWIRIWCNNKIEVYNRVTDAWFKTTFNIWDPTQEMIYVVWNMLDEQCHFYTTKQNSFTTIVKVLKELQGSGGLSMIIT